MGAGVAGLGRAGKGSARIGRMGALPGLLVLRVAGEGRASGVWRFFDGWVGRSDGG
ncbi:hypothetical protein GCM10009630_07630 [Kribbella jejuensis]